MTFIGGDIFLVFSFNASSQNGVLLRDLWQGAKLRDQGAYTQVVILSRWICNEKSQGRIARWILQAETTGRKPYDRSGMKCLDNIHSLSWSCLRIWLKSDGCFWQEFLEEVPEDSIPMTPPGITSSENGLVGTLLKKQNIYFDMILLIQEVSQLWKKE